MAAPLLGAASPVPRDRYFSTSDGVRLHYQEAGPPAAPLLILVPGWDMPGWIFAPQIAAFAATHHVVAFDPRGQGDSAIPARGYDATRRGEDIHDLLATLGARDAVVAGWSLGVLDVLAEIARHGSAGIGGLVLIDNSVGEFPPPAPPGRVRHRRMHRFPGRAGAMASFVRGMFRHPQNPPYLARLTEAALRVPAPYSYRLLHYAEPRSFWRAALLSVRLPVLYVVRPGLAGQAASLARDDPGATAVVVRHVGHALFVDDADGFNRTLRAFLRAHGL